MDAMCKRGAIAAAPLIFASLWGPAIPKPTVAAHRDACALLTALAQSVNVLST
jgi:hypothetical protein